MREERREEERREEKRGEDGLDPPLPLPFAIHNTVMDKRLLVSEVMQYGL